MGIDEKQSSYNLVCGGHKSLIFTEIQWNFYLSDCSTISHRVLIEPCTKTIKHAPQSDEAFIDVLIQTAFLCLTEYMLL